MTVKNVELHLEIESSFISEGDAAPTHFNVVLDGLVCDDIAPIITNFIIKDQNGMIQTGNLNGGTYNVFADLSDLSGYDNYTISQTAGSLFVNPLVGCNDRIKASDICQSPATLAGSPNIESLLRFEYTNSLDVPIYIPNGSNNRLKGNAQFIGSPPELFLPGTHTFDIYTNGGRLQWEVSTQGCSSASKSPNGSNADPCEEYSSSSALTSTIKASVSKQQNEGQTILYPNPATDVVNILLVEKTGSARLTIFDITGRTLFKKDYQLNKSSNIQVDVSDYNSGILFFIYQHNGKKALYKIVKK